MAKDENLYKAKEILSISINNSQIPNKERKILHNAVEESYREIKARKYLEEKLRPFGNHINQLLISAVMGNYDVKNPYKNHYGI